MNDFDRSAPISKQTGITKTNVKQVTLPTGSKSEKLEISVIPVDADPYSKIINVPPPSQGNFHCWPAGKMEGNSQSLMFSNLKDIFINKESLWRPVFGNYVQANKQPLFSIFRKKIEVYEKDHEHISKNPRVISQVCIFYFSSVMARSFHEMHMQTHSKSSARRTSTVR